MSLLKDTVSRRAFLSCAAKAGTILTLAPLGLSACGEEPKPALRVASNQWLGYEPLYSAREHVLFDRHTVTLVEFTSASAIMRALRNNNVEVAALTLDEALQLTGDGLDLVALWPADTSVGGDALLFHPETTAQTLSAGLRIGLEVGAVGSYFLARTCDQLGFPIDQLTLVSIPAGEHEQAFAEHLIDGLVTFEPMRSRLLAAGAREIFSSRHIPNEIVDVIVTRRMTVQKRLGDLQTLAQAWFSAADSIRARESATLSRLASRQRLSQKEIQAALDGISFPTRSEALTMISDQKAGLPQTVRRLGAFLKVHYKQDFIVLGESLLDPVLSATVLGESS